MGRMNRIRHGTASAIIPANAGTQGATAGLIPWDATRVVSQGFYIPGLLLSCPSCNPVIL